MFVVAAFTKMALGLRYSESLRFVYIYQPANFWSGYIAKFSDICAYIIGAIKKIQKIYLYNLKNTFCTKLQIYLLYAGKASESHITD